MLIFALCLIACWLSAAIGFAAAAIMAGRQGRRRQADNFYPRPKEDQ